MILLNIIVHRIDFVIWIYQSLKFLNFKEKLHNWIGYVSKWSPSNDTMYAVHKHCVCVHRRIYYILASFFHHHHKLKALNGGENSDGSAQDDGNSNRNTIFGAVVLFSLCHLLYAIFTCCFSFILGKCWVVYFYRLVGKANKFSSHRFVVIFQNIFGKKKVFRKVYGRNYVLGDNWNHFFFDSNVKYGVQQISQYTNDLFIELLYT